MRNIVIIIVLTALIGVAGWAQNTTGSSNAAIITTLLPYGFMLFVALLALLIALVSGRRWEKSNPLMQPYRWGFYLGWVLMLTSGLFAFSAFAANELGWLILTAVFFIVGFFTVNRHKWAFITSAILGGPIAWGAAFPYLKNRREGFWWGKGAKTNYIALTGLIGVLVFSVGGLLVGAPSNPKNEPQEFISAVVEFRVSTPFKLEESTQLQDSSIGKLEYHVFSGGNDEVAHAIMYVDYPQAMTSIDPQKFLDGGRDGMLSSIKGKLLSEKKIFIDGCPGREYIVDATSGGFDLTIAQRCYLVGNRLYTISVTAQKSKVDIVAMNRFFDSFRLLGDL